MSKKSKRKSLKAPKASNSFEQNILEVYAASPFSPLNIKQVSSRLGITDSASRKIVQGFIYKLQSKGALVPIGRAKHKINPELVEQLYTGGEIVGVVDMKPSGSAYIISKELEDDVFVAPHNTGTAFHGDTVKIILLPSRGRRRSDGKVVEIIKRKTINFVGKLEISKNFAFCVSDKPSNPNDFFIPLSKLGGAKNGEKVIVQFTDWPKNAKNPFAEVVKVLGKPGDHEVEMMSILASNDFPTSFPKEVEKAANKIPVEISKDEISKRKDYRRVFTCTIDPEDAKDFDDALSYQVLENGNIEVGVHIADVSHYVKRGDRIDKEAYDRATSIYLVDRVIPMLPEVLSNNVCSLRPHEEKLCFAAIFEFDSDFEVKKHWIGRTIIESNRRYCYEEVQEMIEGKAQDENTEALLKLNEIAVKLRADRYKKGSIAFRSREIRFKLDEHKKPIGAYVREQKEAHKLIEDFMLLANKYVAEFVGISKNKKKNPKTFVYRIHDVPNEEKLHTFSEFIKKFGYRVSLNSRKSLVTSMNALFEKIRGKGEEHLIETIAVRTMSKAVYSTENIGHYGLSFRYYTHFTSPIRRYPDLMVHRLLEHYLDHGSSVNANEYEDYCKHCSDMEKKAADAERESVKYKQAEYMLDKVGQEFNGIISGVSKWGFFVEVEAVQAEGMVPIQTLDDDYYYLDEDNYQILGRQHGTIYRLGDHVNIVVQKVDLVKKQMEFSLVD